MPTHSEKRQLPWSARQIYDLVADVAAYPDFLPWVAAARIRRRQPLEGGRELMEADLVVSFKVFRERFGSRVTLDPGNLTIDVAYIDGPFRHLDNHWRFTDLPEGGSEVDFFVDFEFRSPLLQKVIGLVFNEAMQRIVRAFEARAEQIYGPPSG